MYLVRILIGVILEHVQGQTSRCQVKRSGSFWSRSWGCRRNRMRWKVKKQMIEQVKWPPINYTSDSKLSMVLSLSFPVFIMFVNELLSPVISKGTCSCYNVYVWMNNSSYNSVTRINTITISASLSPLFQCSFFCEGTSEVYWSIVLSHKLKGSLCSHTLRLM